MQLSEMHGVGGVNTTGKKEILAAPLRMFLSRKAENHWNENIGGAERVKTTSHLCKVVVTTMWLY